MGLAGKVRLGFISAWPSPVIVPCQPVLGLLLGMSTRRLLTNSGLEQQHPDRGIYETKSPL